MAYFTNEVNPSLAKLTLKFNGSLSKLELTHWGREKWPTFPRRHFEMHFLEWKCMNLDYNFSLNVVPCGSINNIQSLVQIMAWRLPGDKPLSEPMVVGLPTHICVTRPRWVNFHSHWCLRYKIRESMFLWGKFSDTWINSLLVKCKKEKICFDISASVS